MLLPHSPDLLPLDRLWYGGATHARFSHLNICPLAPTASMLGWKQHTPLEMIGLFARGQDFSYLMLFRHWILQF